MMKKHSTRRHPWIAEADAKFARQELDKLVQDRKTGERYDPKQAFDRLMNKSEIMASLNRLKIR
jgi:hypothetical protein